MSSNSVVLPLIQNISLSTYPSSDPAGITYNPVSGRLVISDSEIDEIPTLFTGANVFETTLTGQLLDVRRTTNFSNEPTGISYALISGNNRYFVADDDADKITLVNTNASLSSSNPVPRYSLISQFDTRPFGSDDPEDVTFAPDLDHLFIIDGLDAEVYRVTTSGTLVSQFDTLSLGVEDPEGIIYNQDTQSLFIIGKIPGSSPSRPAMIEVTTAGALVRTFDMSALDGPNVKLAGITLAPSSNNPSGKSLYIVDRGEDNATNPNQNDGRLYEFSLAAPNQAPVLNSFNLTISEGGIVVLAGSNINVTDPDSTAFTYSASNVMQGNFQTLSGTTWSNTTSFTSAQVSAGQVRFVHNGGEAPPSFQVTANDGTSNSNTIAATVSFTNVNDAPTLNSVSFSVAQGGTTVLTPTNFNITDPDSSSFTYSASNVTQGSFQTTSNGTTWTNATSFTSAQLSAGQVRFVHSGTTAPTFQIQANDGATVNSLSNTISGSVTFVPSSQPFSTIYASLDGNSTVGGIAFRDEDILAFNTTTQTWSMYFDGSDVGLSSFDLEAFHIMSDGSILLALNNPATIAGVGSVDDSDILRFTPTSTGDSTAGTFQLYFDGSDVGLTTNNEKIDAIALDRSGRLVISTKGSFDATGLSGADEDLIVFNATSLGDSTSGTWSMYFDGSDVGLSQSSSEDVDGVWLDSSGDIYLSTLGAFSVTGLSGDGNDIFRFTPGSLGANTSGNYAALWDGAAFGLGTRNIDSFFLA